MGGLGRPRGFGDPCEGQELLANVASQCWPTKEPFNDARTTLLLNAGSTMQPSLLMGGEFRPDHQHRCSMLLNQHSLSMMFESAFAQ
jgi:hypothetical protein